MHPARKRYIERHDLKLSDVSGVSNEELERLNRIDDRMRAGFRMVVVVFCAALLIFAARTFSDNLILLLWHAFLLGILFTLFFENAWDFARSFRGRQPS